MPTAKTPDPESKSEGQVELAKLIEGGLARQGASARSIAQRVGIGASHFSKVLKAKRSLRQAKLMMIADLLGLDQEKVLRLAGFGGVERSRVDLGRVTLLRTLDKFALNVVVTPRFYDAAVFMWIFSQQPLTEVGVASQLRRVDWANVPAEIASYTYSVGFHSQTPSLFKLARWSHLSLDKGLALIGREGSVGKGKAAVIELAHQAERKGKRLLLIAIDQALVELLRDTTGLEQVFDVQIIANPEVALESFRAGAGDLFMGGLAQRLALRNGPFRELIVQGKDFPRLYSLNSLICSERMMKEKRPLLHAIDALWYDTCRRLYAEAEFRTLVFDQICDVLDRHGVEKHSLVKADFQSLFTPDGQEFEVFAETPVALWEEEKRIRKLLTAC